MRDDTCCFSSPIAMQDPTEPQYDANNCKDIERMEIFRKFMPSLQQLAVSLRTSGHLKWVHAKISGEKGRANTYISGNNNTKNN